MIKTLSDIIAEFPEQLLEGIRVGATVKIPRLGKPHPSTLVICGMGGSALPGLLLRDSVQSEKTSNLQIVVHRDYALPQLAHRASAICIISYSGNTEEALSSYREAKKIRIPLFVIASGGTLVRWAKRDRVSLVELAPGYLPRFALPQMFGAVTAVATKHRLLDQSLLRKIKKSAKNIRPSALRKTARALLDPLAGRVPLVYAREEIAALPYIWKIQMNENAKIPAFANTLPELNHNELNIFTDLSNRQSQLRKRFSGILLRDTNETPQIKKRFDTTRTIMRRSGVPTIDVLLRGDSAIERSFYSIILGEWTSVMLAERYGVDPLPVALIEKFKKALDK